jgi:hypothetical protein
MSVPWDKLEAIEELTKATLAGDYAAVKQAWHRMTEAKTNEVAGVMAGQLIPILTDIQLLIKAVKRISTQHKEDEAGQAHVNAMIVALEASNAARIAALEARLPERRQGDSPHEEERRVGE